MHDCRQAPVKISETATQLEALQAIIALRLCTAAANRNRRGNVALGTRGLRVDRFIVCIAQFYGRQLLFEARQSFFCRHGGF